MANDEKPKRLRTRGQSIGGRRDFLKGIGLLSAAVAGAASIGSERAEAYDPGRQELRPRYQPDSPDVQSFYRTNRYETG